MKVQKGGGRSLASEKKKVGTTLFRLVITLQFPQTPGCTWEISESYEQSLLHLWWDRFQFSSTWKGLAF